MHPLIKKDIAILSLVSETCETTPLGNVTIKGRYACIYQN